MKVYYWTPYMGNVGTIKATINSAIALKQLGYDVKIYKPYREWEGYEEILEENNIDIIDFGLSEKFPNLPTKKLGFRFSMILISFYSFSKLIKNWREDKPDVVLAYLLGYLPLLARFFSEHKPYIVNSIQGKPRFNSFRKILWDCLYSKSDQIIVLSDQTKKDIIENINYPENKVIKISNPIIDKNIDILADEKLDEEYEKTNVPIILGVGRLSRQKNFETLIRAFYLVQKDVPCQLWILGEGEEREKLQNIISELQIEDNARLIGFVPNPYKFMKKADVFVLSSLWEDAGHVLVEAAYMKLKLVSTRCPHGQEEFLDYGKNGELCEVQKPEDMKRAILVMLDDDLEEENIEKVNLAYEAAMEYNLDHHGKILSDLIERVSC